MVGAEAADLALHPAFLVCSLDARAAVEALDAEVRAEGDPPVRLHFEEGFLAAGSEDPVDGLARIRQPEGEQIAGDQLAGEPHRHVAEVDLGLHTGLMRLRHERFHGGLA
ncbi:hypothetical protein ACIHFC_35325 [Streptomyces sp. NPDC052013]|uniref:hypothetical protein n=1 Tax=Streptomyces sp. NPDC052013 TaxID=3365679 RepID=UPI0037D34E5B